MENNNLIELLIGTNNYTYFLASLLFAIIGVILSLLFNFTKRDVNDPRSPLQFSLKFLLSDNIKRILIAIICIFICLRFSNEILGIESTLFAAFIIGLSMDNLAKIIQKKIVVS